MKFFADENVGLLIVQWLRQKGHDVLYAAEADSGQDDAIWLHQAERSKRLIVTADKDFGDLIFRDRLNKPWRGVDSDAQAELARAPCTTRTNLANYRSESDRKVHRHYRRKGSRS